MAASAAATGFCAVSRAACRCSGQSCEPGVRLGYAEVEKQCRLVARWRRFSKRSAQEDRLRFGSALPRRRAGSLDQPLDDPAIGSGLADQQVLSDARRRRWLLREQCGGTAVALCALRTGELRVDPVADERVHERQRSAVLDDPRGRQQIGCIGCLELFEARESRRVEQVALLENRQRSCQLPGMPRQTTEPEEG